MDACSASAVKVALHPTDAPLPSGLIAISHSEAVTCPPSAGATIVYRIQMPQPLPRSVRET
jgi:hypothetical protein